MSDWRLAESLKRLREQINAAFPTRDKTSDGAIGDAAHASRNSDHNPWVSDGKQGVVTAIDIDEDLNDNDFTLEDLVTAIRKSKDPRVKYIIYEGRITVAGSELQRWKKYTGKNAHSHHAHISVNSDRGLYDDRSDWKIGVKVPYVAAAEKTAESLPESSASTDSAIGSLQAKPAELSQPAAASLISVPTAVVDVEQVSAENAKPENEDVVAKFQNRFLAIPAAIFSAIGAAAAWATSAPLHLVLVLIGAGVLITLSYLGINALRNNAKEKREHELTREREQRAHEIQMATLKSAMDPSLQTVRVVPQPMQNSEPPPTSEGAES